MNLTVNECKVLWVVGAAERLATLGLLSSDIPMKLTSDAVDDYLQIDEYRELLFSSDFEVANIFTAIANEECDSELQDPDDLKPVIVLLIDYKNNRTDVVKYALSHQLI